jgi:hypothetical protein
MLLDVFDRLTPYLPTLSLALLAQTCRENRSLLQPGLTKERSRWVPVPPEVPAERLQSLDRSKLWRDNTCIDRTALRSVLHTLQRSMKRDEVLKKLRNLDV